LFFIILYDGNKLNADAKLIDMEGEGIYNYYLTFTKNGGKPWSDAGGPEAWAAGQAGKFNSKGIIPDKKVGDEKLPKNVSMLPGFDLIKEKVMILGFFAKFTQNEELKNMLLNTNDAELWHFVTKGRPKQLWNHLMNVRECIRKYDKLYDLKSISKFSSEKISNVFKNTQENILDFENAVIDDEDDDDDIIIKKPKVNILYDETVNIDLSQLIANGVQVIPAPKDIHTQIKNFNHQLIEYINPSEEIPIMGGFGAYGNPTSFHHPEIRNIRSIIHSYMWNSFLNTFPGKKAELLIDRFSKRRTGTSTMAESWHRDITNSKNVLINDNIYGGWVNLDPPGSDAQGFSCVPGTHHDVTEKTGFVKFTDEEIKDFKKRKTIFKIPPGHIIIFNQNIVHEVLPKKSIFDSYRLYIGWRITDSSIPLYDNTKVIEDQGIIILPGGMKPPMYYGMHWMAHREKLIEWSRKVRPEFKEEKLFKKEGIYFNVVQQYMISLREAGLPLWPEYSDYEKLILKPQFLK
jgi:hypothetical protein